jgi:hypothetical protein
MTNLKETYELAYAKIDNIYPLLDTLDNDDIESKVANEYKELKELMFHIIDKTPNCRGNEKLKEFIVKLAECSTIISERMYLKTSNEWFLQINNFFDDFVLSFTI